MQMGSGSDLDARGQKALEDRLVAMVAGSAFTMQALRAARGLGLSSWCIGAGAVRNLVWDHLHGFEAPTENTDVDLVYFDPVGPSGEAERALEAALSRQLPDCRWEAVNQAHVHRWLQTQTADRIVPPFRSLKEGVGSWPEVATCVGVTLDEAHGIRVIAPHGLCDLFDMVVRPNPSCVSGKAFAARLAAKRWDVRWPGVTVLRAPELHGQAVAIREGVR